LTENEKISIEAILSQQKYQVVFAYSRFEQFYNKSERD
jgi:hypothetical protein